MRSSELSIEQAHRLKDQVARRLHYLNSLVDRMTKMGFPPEDQLYAAAIRARAFMQDLHVQAHYAGVKHGVARSLEDWPEDIVKRA